MTLEERHEALELLEQALRRLGRADAAMVGKAHDGPAADD